MTFALSLIVSSPLLVGNFACIHQVCETRLKGTHVPVQRRRIVRAETTLRSIIRGFLCVLLPYVFAARTLFSSHTASSTIDSRLWLLEGDVSGWDAAFTLA